MISLYDYMVTMYDCMIACLHCMVTWCHDCIVWLHDYMITLYDCMITLFACCSYCLSTLHMYWRLHMFMLQHAVSPYRRYYTSDFTACTCTSWLGVACSVRCVVMLCCTLEPKSLFSLWGESRYDVTLFWQAGGLCGFGGGHGLRH